jgi:hypothetical protein
MNQLAQNFLTLRWDTRRTPALISKAVKPTMPPSTAPSVPSGRCTTIGFAWYSTMLVASDVCPHRRAPAINGTTCAAARIGPYRSILLPICQTDHPHADGRLATLTASFTALASLARVWLARSAYRAAVQPRQSDRGVRWPTSIRAAFADILTGQSVHFRIARS